MTQVALPDDVRYLRSMRELEQQADSLGRRRPAPRA